MKSRAKKYGLKSTIGITPIDRQPPRGDGQSNDGRAKSTTKKDAAGKATPHDGTESAEASLAVSVAVVDALSLGYRRARLAQAAGAFEKIECKPMPRADRSRTLLAATRPHRWRFERLPLDQHGEAFGSARGPVARWRPSNAEFNTEANQILERMVWWRQQNSIPAVLKLIPAERLETASDESTGGSRPPWSHRRIRFRATPHTSGAALNTGTRADR